LQADFCRRQAGGKRNRGSGRCGQDGPKNIQRGERENADDQGADNKAFHMFFPEEAWAALGAAQTIAGLGPTNNAEMPQAFCARILPHHVGIKKPATDVAGF
jgi:hypothetical protein